MIADTTFLIHLMAERRANRRGPALAFLAVQRPGIVRTSIVSLAEIAVSFPKSEDAWEYFKYWRIYPLHRGIAAAAADVDRELIRGGGRLGENDNWIAGFGRYFREPIISRDVAFDRVPRLRRLAY
jgi:predicted nucleic acid-binding protein